MSSFLLPLGVDFIGESVYNIFCMWCKLAFDVFEMHFTHKTNITIFLLEEKQ